MMGFKHDYDIPDDWPMTRIERDIEHWVQMCDMGDCTYQQAVAALAELGCGDEDIALLIGPDPDTGEAPRAKFIPDYRGGRSLMGGLPIRF